MTKHRSYIRLQNCVGILCLCVFSLLYSHFPIDCLESLCVNHLITLRFHENRHDKFEKEIGSVQNQTNQEDYFRFSV